MRKTIVVCDVCESGDRVSAWELRSVQTGRKRKVELCARHADPIATLLDPDTSIPPPRPSNGRRRRGADKVTSLAEVEAQVGAEGAQ